MTLLGKPCMLSTTTTKTETLFNNDELREHAHDKIEVAYKISILFSFLREDAE